MDAFEGFVASLGRHRVRFVVIGLSGANYYARSASTLFLTKDRDLLLPLEPENALRAWRSCESVGLELFCGDELLDRPRDLLIAKRIVSNRALVRATDRAGLDVDLSFVMAGFDFEPVWLERRIFRSGGVDIPVARFAHIVESKRRAGRDKDRLFFASHAEAIRDLVEEDAKGESGAVKLAGRKPSRKRRRSPGKRAR